MLVAAKLLTLLIYAFFYKSIKQGIKIHEAILYGFLGILPFVLWEVFCVVYYGFPFPNTMYAKLSSGIPTSEYISHGWEYLFVTLSVDPIGIMAIVFAIAVSFTTFAQKKNINSMLLSIGIIVYQVYLFRIGGDYMVGRLYTPMIFIAVVLLQREFRASAKTIAATVTILVIISASRNLYNPLSVSNKYSSTHETYIQGGIADERQFYFPQIGLVTQTASNNYKTHGFYTAVKGKEFDKVVYSMNIGLCRIALPDSVHLLDAAGLSDALLARLPHPYQSDWRVGHLMRPAPNGYMETLANGANVIEDEGLREYYSKLHSIISEPIFSVQRFKGIVYMNFGKFDDLIDFNRYRYPNILFQGETAELSDLQEIKVVGTPYSAPGNITLESNVVILLQEISHAKAIDIGVDWNDRYEIVFLRNGEVVGYKTIIPSTIEGINRQYLELNASTYKEGYDTIIVQGLDGDGWYVLGHLVLR